MQLNTGARIPILGHGTWKMSVTDAYQSTLHALTKAGYRHVDTAFAYQNEQGVGRAVRESEIPRDQIFVTTKLPPSKQGYEIALQTFNESLSELGLEYVDLYLIHWPGVVKLPENSPEHSKLRAQSWKALEKIHADGKAKAIGVSNYTVNHLKELMSQSQVVPAVNQIEFHPLLFAQQRDVLEFCKQHNIVVEAYSPLASGSSKLLELEELKEIASECNKTPAQVLIRWCIQHGTVVLPKSTHSERIDSNADAMRFQLSEKHMHQLDTLHERAGSFRSCWNPEGIL